MACKPEDCHHHACDCREEAFQAVKEKAFAVLKAYGDFVVAFDGQDARVKRDAFVDALVELERALRKV